MTTNNSLQLTSFLCASLEFNLELGTVKNAVGETQRLSPINLKLLAYLTSHHGEVITRTELFDAIWPNQIVSDDVLTRAISDIRTLLGKLDVSTKYIETLPKRGYRWVAEVVSTHNFSVSPIVSPTSKQQAKLAGKTHYNYRNAVVDLMLSVFLAFLVMWWISQPNQNQIKMVVLPTQSEMPQTDLPAKILNENMLLVLRKNPDIKLLSKSAVDSRPHNPFPYFFKEFGATWVLESRIRNSEGFYNLELSLVDARTGIEIRSTHIEFVDIDEALTKLAKKIEANFLVERTAY